MNLDLQKCGFGVSVFKDACTHDKNNQVWGNANPPLRD